MANWRRRLQRAPLAWRRLIDAQWQQSWDGGTVRIAEAAATLGVPLGELALLWRAQFVFPAREAGSRQLLRTCDLAALAQLSGEAFHLLCRSAEAEIEARARGRAREAEFVALINTARQRAEAAGRPKARPLGAEACSDWAAEDVLRATRLLLAGSGEDEGPAETATAAARRQRP